MESYTVTHDPEPAAQLPPWVRLLRVAERREEWASTAPVIRDDSDVDCLLRERLAGEEVETIVVVAVDAKQRVLGIHEVSRGGLHGAAVTCREIFRAAVALGAAAVLLAHNHPSGDRQPSSEDVEMTTRVREAGKVLGVPLLDHVIIAASERYSFFAEGVLS